MTRPPGCSPRSHRGPATCLVVLLTILATACGPSSGAPTSPEPAATPVATASPTGGIPTPVATSPLPDPSPSIDTPASVGATADPTSPDATAAVDGTSATATASTLFDTRRAFRLELRHDGPSEEMTGLVLDSPWYEPVEATPRSFTLTSGLVLVPLPYGPATCGAGSPEPGAVVGEVVLETAGGPRRFALRPHPANLVAQRHRRECAVAAIEEVADLTFGDDWTPVAPRVVTGALVVSVDVDHSIEVRGVEGNIIFAMEAQQALPFAVDGGSSRLTVRVSAARCDTHALIEAKRKLHFPLSISLDGADPVVVEVEATGAAGQVFQALLESCLDAPPT